MGMGHRALGCLLLLPLGACYSSAPFSGEDAADRSPGPPAVGSCDAGERRSCECADGFRMDVRCEGGQWPGCPCATPECAPGETRQCTCAVGQPGREACSPGGFFSVCECSSPLPDPDPEPPAGQPGVIVAQPDDEASFLWDEAQLQTFELELRPQDLAMIDGSPAAELYVPGNLHHGEDTYEVGIRYKGSYGAFLAPCTGDGLGQLGGPKVGKCSIKVSFHWNNPGGRFHGLKKLQFHSLGHDPSLMRERLGYATFRQMGVAAPRAVHARLMINGRYVGLYALVENIDGSFTRAHFSEGGEGNLYKEVWPTHDNPDIYLAALRTNRDEMPSVQQMRDFGAAVEAGPVAAARWLDMDVMARYLAVDRVLINDDGIMHFWCSTGGQGGNPGPYGNHNYYWYFAADSSRAWLIPWDLDSSMQIDGFVQVYSDWLWPQEQCGCQTYPQQSFPVAQAPPNCDPLIGGWATMRERYDAQVDALLAGPLAGEAVDAKLDAWSSQIRAAVVEQQDAGIIAVEEGVLDVPSWEYALQTLRADLAYMRDNRGYGY